MKILDDDIDIISRKILARLRLVLANSLNLRELDTNIIICFCGR